MIKLVLHMPTNTETGDILLSNITPERIDKTSSFSWWARLTGTKLKPQEDSTVESPGLELVEELGKAEYVSERLSNEDSLQKEASILLKNKGKDKYNDAVSLVKQIREKIDAMSTPDSPEN